MLILRTSQKVAKKIKEAPDRIYPQHANPYLDWSSHLFRADRKQHIILTNTHSLYSIVCPAKGITNFKHFVLAVNHQIEEFLRADGFEVIYKTIIEPQTATSVFSKALNRSVTGYINDFVWHATICLAKYGLTPQQTSFKLNQIPLLKRDFFNPREEFFKMGTDFMNNTTYE